MNGNYFLDTNILVYTFDQTQLEKQDIAKQLVRKALNTRSGCISYQVIQEFLHVASRKFATPLSTADCQNYLSNVLEPLCEVFSSTALFHRALEISSRWQFAFYDSLIIAAALSAESRILYSEDLQHDQKIDDMTIINPFLSL
ncbi:MAG: PIN domain-containing protein [Acaryochloris sp. RU_4_1]|nr:PIN domain-containing protein [Acaryochloris sp. SU_5_25]NJM66968.1 PIN domain-containing protein [Acaryochloris sp. RU_4_1]NJR55810.1 PIN domain-containing protein [Acaryochloris sp. CRU_2_0]